MKWTTWIVGAMWVPTMACQGFIAEPSGHADSDGGVRRPGEPPPDPDAQPGARQARLLSAREYGNTVRDLLGVEVSPDLHFGDTSTGFDNANGTPLDENLLSRLWVSAEEAARTYVRETMPTEFPCIATLDDACVDTVLRDLGRRAFRKPLDTTERAAFADFARRMRADADDPRHAAELLVTRLLLSPRFLYRTEVGVRAGDVAVLDPFERASLLSYTLTASMPDEALLADAEADRLDEATVRGHVARLLDTDAGRLQLFELFKQWLRAGELDRMASEPEAFAKLTSPELGVALRDELATFVERVVLEEEATLADVLTRRSVPVDRHTAPLYGLEAEGEAPEDRTIPSHRPGGVLSLASVLAVHASRVDVDRENPIHRGLLVRNQLFCEPIALPSGLDLQDAVDAVGQPDDWETLPQRDRLEHVMQQGEACQGCHATFMPFGYLWSHFDGLGQYRTEHHGHPLDSSVDAVLVDGEVRAYADAKELLPDLARSEGVASCFRRQLARFVSGGVEGALVDHAATARSRTGLPIVQQLEDMLAHETLYVREVAR
ncbi:MAG: DUF1592 domain-containing protein [Polyangiales bacterium]